MIEFILNDKLIKTSESPGATLLDFVRYKQGLVGTKIGCREGDCGACTLLVGQLVDGNLKYHSLTSCISPLGNAAGKHIVSIEGLNMKDLSPFQQAMVDESGQQCGFCTVGFIVSFAGACLSDKPISYERVLAAIDGNICRCTGYKPIERAAQIVYEKLMQKDNSDSINWLVENGFIPEYFKSIKERLIKIDTTAKAQNGLLVGGGTDLLVQRHDDIYEMDLELVSKSSLRQGITTSESEVIIEGGTTTTQLMESELMISYFPNLAKHLKLVSSTQIRNMATVAGNFINASPIGDLTAFFIALDTRLILSDKEENTRSIKLRELYLDYKKLDKTPEEFIKEIRFKTPDSGYKFNFEKVSKRRHLDIASVTTAIHIKTELDTITELRISAGGVGPTPMLLSRTCKFLLGKKLNTQTLSDALQTIPDEISPISDARGSKEYKALLLKQLVIAHFVELFPDKINPKSIA